MSRRKVITIASIMAAVIVLAVVGVWVYVCHSTWGTYQTALTQEKTTHTTMQKHKQELGTLFVDEKTCIGNVLEDDKPLCTDAVKLLDTVENTQPVAVQKLAHHVIDLPSHVSLVKTETGKHEKQEKEIKNVDKKIVNHIETLRDAFLAKATSDYEAQVEVVKTSITALGQLVTDTEGKVLDNATRDTVSQAVKGAQAILDEKIDLTSLDSVREQIKKLTTQATILSEKSKAITASHDAWQAEQDRAAQQAASGSNHNGGAYNNRNNSNGSSGGWDYSQGNPDDSPTTWDNESNRTDLDYQLPEGFRDM